MLYNYIANYNTNYMNKSIDKKYKPWKGFVQGSVGAVIGGCSAHPLDLIKVRMQLQGENIKKNKVNLVKTGLNIIKYEGILGFFKGIDACIARQIVYSGTRFGMYDILKKSINEKDNDISITSKILCAALAGSIGSFVANPGDLVLVRMQADGNKPLGEKRGYKNFSNAFMIISRKEGFLNMWTNGLFPNMNRAIITTVGQLAMYDLCKERLKKYGAKECISTHFGASLMAAFIASAMSNPIDVSKTRLMNQNTQKNIYTGMWNCITTIIKKEGIVSLYKGFSATFIRQCPYLVVTWITIEQLKLIM